MSVLPSSGVRRRVPFSGACLLRPHGTYSDLEDNDCGTSETFGYFLPTKLHGVTDNSCSCQGPDQANDQVGARFRLLFEKCWVRLCTETLKV